MLKKILALTTAAAVALPGTFYATPIGLGLDASRALQHQDQAIQTVQGGGRGKAG
jgi:hypothetical protein